MFSSPLLSPQRDELALPATSKALLTSLLISIISTYRSHIRWPFDGTIRRASLEHVLVPTAVSTTRRALSPCDVEGSLDKPVNWRAARAPHLSYSWEKSSSYIYIYNYMFFIYIYIYIRSYVVHVPFTRALRANVGPAGWGSTVNIIALKRLL